MPVKVIEGNLFTSEAQTLTNTVNCVGVMGRGIALEFKSRYPKMFRLYRQMCDKKEVKIGEPYVYRCKDKWILNFPTKIHWRRKSKMEWILDGLDYLVANYEEWGITSIAMPPLGCNNGGLKFSDVFPVMKSTLNHLDIPVEICILRSHRHMLNDISVAVVDEIRD